MFSYADQLTSIWHKRVSGTTNTLSRYEYSYDATGNRTNMVGTSGSLVRSESYSCDAQDQLTGVTYKTGSTVDRIVSYFYDSAGNRTNLIEKIGSITNTTAFAANSDNQLTSVTTTRQGVTVTGVVSPGASSNKWYNSTAASRGVNAGVSSTNGTFTIPGVPVNGGANALTVTVTDVSGNIATQVVNVTVATTATALGYDGNGNQTNDAVFAYTYDRENRLVSATSASLVVNYSYDPLGRLIERRTSGSSGTTNRMYYAGWQLIAEYDEAGTLQRKYVYGPGIDEPLRMTTGTTNLYYHADGLGSVAEITDGSGLKVEGYAYDVFGAPTFYNASGVVTNGSAVGNRLLFTARDRDPDTGWYNYRLRYYSPGTGRFVQPEPLRLLGDGVNLYAYVLNNPTSLIDSEGASAREAADFWADIAANNYGTGFWGELKAFGGNTMNMFINMWHANEIERHAELSGHYSAIPGCAGKALLHGGAVIGYAGWDFVQFSGLAKLGQVSSLDPLRVQGAVSSGARTEAGNLAEQMALREARGGAGQRIMQGKIKDALFPESTYAKMGVVVENSAGKTVAEVHYWKNLVTGARFGFKFK